MEADAEVVKRLIFDHEAADSVVLLETVLVEHLEVSKSYKSVMAAVSSAINLDKIALNRR